MRLPPGLCPGPRWGAYSAPRPPAGKGWVEGQSRIFVRCPPFPRNQQMSRIFRKWYYYFFPLPILHVCLATQQSDELRIKIGKDRFRIRTPTGHCLYIHCRPIIDQCDRCHLYYTRGSRHQRLFIFSTLPRPPAASTLLP